MHHFRHVRQPEESNLCGQACLAMILGTPLSVAIELVGKSGCTRASDLRAPMARHGWTLGPNKRWSRGLRLEMKLLVIAFPIPVRSKHWIVVDGLTVHDPAIEGGKSFEGFYLPCFSAAYPWHRSAKDYKRITSYYDLGYGGVDL